MITKIINILADKRPLPNLFEHLLLLSQISVKMPTHCVVKNCSRKGSPVHPIPNDRSTKRKWLNALTKPSFPPSAGVCELHFTGMYFINCNYIICYHDSDQKRDFWWSNKWQFIWILYWWWFLSRVLSVPLISNRQ